RKHHIPVGSSVRILFRGPSQMFTVTGTVAYGKETSFGGTSSAFFSSSTAQRLLGSSSTYDEVQVRSNGDVSDKVLAQRIDAALPKNVEAVTGAQAAKEAADTIKQVFSFVSVLFSIFAAIALFV